MKRTIAVFGVVLMFASAIAAWAGCNTIKSSKLDPGGVEQCMATTKTPICQKPDCSQGSCSQPTLTQDGGCNNDSNSQYCGVVANEPYSFYLQNFGVVGQVVCQYKGDLGQPQTATENFHGCSQDSVKQTGRCSAGYNTPDDACK